MTGETVKRVRSICLCAVFGCTMELAAALLLGSILAFFPETAAGYQGQMDSKLAGGMISLFIVAFFSPLFEEAVFRFLLLGILERKTGFAAANVIQALIFGIYHMSLIQGIYAFLLGMLIGLLKHYTGTLISCICFHVFFNITGILVNIYMPAETGTINRTAAMIAGISVSCVLFILIRRYRCDVQKG